MKILKITLTMCVNDDCSQGLADQTADDALDAALGSIGYEHMSPEDAEAEASATLSDDPRVLNEYRCTRSTLYRHECPGRDDITARQGHYVWAETPDGARSIMSRDFPDDMGPRCGVFVTNADAFTADPTGKTRTV